MGETAFRVVFTTEALQDLDELSDYWSRRGEAWRGEKYYHDLLQRAAVELSDSSSARRGRTAKLTAVPSAREILAFGIYRIIYVIDEQMETVDVLRFWHAHRDEPGRDA